MSSVGLTSNEASLPADYPAQHNLIVTNYEDRYYSCMSAGHMQLIDDSSVRAFPFLKLPVELQIQICRMVLFDEDAESGEGRPFFITAQEMDFTKFRALILSRRTRHLTRTSDAARIHWTYTIRRGDRYLRSRPHKETTYEILQFNVPLELGLLSVSRYIRQIAVPVFYGDKCIELYLHEGIIPYFQDRTQLARQNIKDLRIQWIILRSDPSGSSYQLWANNLEHIRVHLTGLRSFAINVIDCADYPGDMLNDMDLRLQDMQLDRPERRWLRALAQLRGLDKFQIKLFTENHVPQHTDHRTVATQSLLQQYWNAKSTYH